MHVQIGALDMYQTLIAFAQEDIALHGGLLGGAASGIGKLCIKVEGEGFLYRERGRDRLQQGFAVSVFSRRRCRD
ncbi:MAG: hypothetical protein BWX80_01706 [Candidatus Hydrogenedentes bacterium ADurb.Bin101]|nr:MAG: hypothetical protein BWX80_01706 [Candidatus Hydrogenedentes bacterium ADurb.Bin101]